MPARSTLVLFAFAALLAFGGLGCGATLTLGPDGWHQDTVPYMVTPLDGGRLVPAGWELLGYAQTDEGYRKRKEAGLSADLQLRRIEDDGVMLVVTYLTPQDDQPKAPEVLLEHWVARVVQGPRAGDGSVELFAPAIPPVRVGTGYIGRSVYPQKQGHVEITGGEGAELVAAIAKPGQPADRMLYAAAIKANGARHVIVAYGNSVQMFDRGLADASAFARRIRF